MTFSIGAVALAKTGIWKLPRFASHSEKHLRNLEKIANALQISHINQGKHEY
jgi:hypothetical protein